MQISTLFVMSDFESDYGCIFVPQIAVKFYNEAQSVKVWGRHSITDVCAVEWIKGFYLINKLPCHKNLQNVFSFAFITLQQLGTASIDYIYVYQWSRCLKRHEYSYEGIVNELV